MFDIFVKREKVVIDFFCEGVDDSSHRAYQIAKPDFAVKYLPDWFKQTPKVLDTYQIGAISEPVKCRHTGKPATSRTIKTCPGLIDLYKQSIAVPSWFLLEVDLDHEQMTTRTPFSEDVVWDNHPNIQFEKYVNEGHAYNIKVSTPWVMQSKPNIKVMFVEPTWDSYYRHHHMRVLPGVMDLKYANQVKINYLMDIPHDDEIFTTRWDILDPLVHMVPLTDKQIEIRHHLVDSSTLSKLKPALDFAGDDTSIMRYGRWTSKSRVKLVNKLAQINPKLWGDK